MKKKTLGGVLKSQRATLGLTQRELALKLDVKPSHIAYLEKDRRRPSLALLNRIGDVLGLPKESLFVLAHPEAKSLLGSGSSEALRQQGPDQVWREFTSNKALLSQHHIKPRELKILSEVNLLGKVTQPRHFLFILNSIRQAVDADEAIL